MGKAVSIVTVVLLLTVVVALPCQLMGSSPLTAAGSPPNSPYQGSGLVLDVDEFARNSSVAYSGGNNTAFSYDGSRFPSGYGGYHLRTSVTSLAKSVDPVPNGDFDQRDEPGNNWTLTQRSLTPYLVQSIDNVTGGNPGYCLEARLYDKSLTGLKTSQIYNNFTYWSAITPSTLTLSFDMKFSSGIYRAAPTLAIDVQILYGGSQWGWSGTTNTSYSPNWTRRSFSTGPVNGSISLRITIRKTVAPSFNPNGSIYFDNFRYAIGSSCPPSEVGLKLNSTAVVDTGGNAGRADIYVDPAAKERVLLASCWTTSLLFRFNSTYTITFDYNYSMYVKTQNLDAAPTFFTAPADAAPTWVANYTVPGGRPPLNHIGYRFGLYLPSAWVFSAVKNGTGQSVSAYSYDASSHYLLLNEGVAGAGQPFSVYASDANHVLQVHAQRGPTASGPWTNTTTTDYFTTGDYVRVFAALQPINVTGNSANVSVFLPNGTLWRSDSAPSFDADRETLTSAAWPLPVVTEGIASKDWLITVCFSTTTQCGMRTQSFATYIEVKGSVISPMPGARCLWGSTVFVNVTWQNNDTLSYVPGAAVRLRYIDRYSQVQYVTMGSNGWGAYFTSISTSLLRPNRTAELDIEFRKLGYINATYSQGTHLPVVFNLVKDLDYHMVRPVQSTGPNEYTGQTSVSVGYATQVKLYDLFEVQYARNDTAPWSGTIHINCSRYEDTGSGWAFAGTGTFLPNAGDATLFEKVDANYSAGLSRVKYTVTARFVGGYCDGQQQNFTVIIEMVAFASNLDVLRTLVTHPPSGTGDGWTVFNPAVDGYEVHLYAGEPLNITVYYENVSALPHLPISDASVDVLVLGSWLSLSNRGNGCYNYTLNTLLLNIGPTQLEVNASRADCAAQTVFINAIIAPRPCQLKPTSLVVDVTWGNAFWIVAYYNDTLSNQPITGAMVQYQWGLASGTLTPTGGPGWYNVSLPTATHVVGQESLTLTVSHGKYQDCEAILSIRIAARATLLTKDTIQSYFHAANVTHPFSVSGSLFEVPVSDEFIVRLRFTDANGSLITDAAGSFSWSRDTVYLVYEDGFYVLQLNLTTVPPDSYPSCQIQLSRQNYAPQLLTFQLNVMSLVPTEISGINNYISHFTGEPFGITVFFHDVYHDVGITGANVTLSIPGLGVSKRFSDLGNGSYTLSQLTYSVEDVFDIEITARAGVWYSCSHQASLVLRARFGGNSLLNLVVLVVAVASIALVSGYLAYSKLLRPRVLKPRRTGRMQKLQDVADMFNDVSNVSRFLVLHRDSGIAIFDPFPEQGMDGALFGGFLQAISAFAVDVARTSEDQELASASRLHEISYEGFRILIHDGILARTALVFKGRPSEKLKQKMEEFTARFEAKYAKELGEACCTPGVYLDAIGLIEDVFQFSLLFPHKVQLKLPDTQRLSSLETKLYGIALAQTEHHDTVLLQDLAKAYTAKSKLDKLEVLRALHQLREKKLLVPVEFYRLPKRPPER